MFVVAMISFESLSLPLCAIVTLGLVKTALSLTSGDFLGFWFPFFRETVLCALITRPLFRTEIGDALSG